MEPTTALILASTAISAVGAISQADASAASERTQQNAMLYSAQVNKNRAQLALQQGNAQEELRRREIRREMGTLRAGLVEGGIGLESGTGADLVEESSLNAEMDALNIRYNASLNAQGLEQQALSDEYSASAAGRRASNASRAGFLGAAGSVLTGAGAAYQTGQQRRLYDEQMKFYKAGGVGAP